MITAIRYAYSVSTFNFGLNVHLNKMALRDQPYLPLYVQDLLTDEKLIECSAKAHGVFFRLICILHKQEIYGLICLKQKYKQSENKIICFAEMLSKQMPFDTSTISQSLNELIDEKVLHIDNDNLFQKRMVKDGELSIIRTDAGKKGGSNVTKQYGKQGFLYLMSDGFDKNKIGISVNPGNRLYRLRCDLKLPKHFEIKNQHPVKDMGKAEDAAQAYFKDILDGEWLISDFESISKKFALLLANLEAKPKAKNKANAEDEIVIEDEVIIVTDLFKELEPKNKITEAFENYLEMRKSIKKTPTANAIDLIKKEVWKLAGHDEELAIKIINQSTVRNWTGVFPLKENNNNLNKKSNVHQTAIPPSKTGFGSL